MSKTLFICQVALCVTLFSLIVLGAGVRLADAGLACPDWPLCFGEVIPSFDTQIFLEWFHRKVALWVGVAALTMAIIIYYRPKLRSELGALAFFSLGLFLVQALLGRETVTQFLKSQIVTAHLMGGYALYALNLLIGYKMFRLRSSGPSFAAPSWQKLLMIGLFALITVQVMLGGLVSTNYAGMACYGFPTCNGEWWPDNLIGPVAIHFIHRLGAYTVAAALIVSGVFVLRSEGSSPFLKNVFKVLIFLVLLQIGWGAAMVYSYIHTGLSLVHSATSLLIFSVVALGSYHVINR